MEKFILESNLERDFIAFFVKNGFDRFFDLYRGGDLKNAFPLGGLRRIPRTGREELVDLQFNKYNKSQFVINFSILDQEEMREKYNESFSMGSLTASELPIYYRSYRSRIFSRWYKINTYHDYSRNVAVINKLAYQILEWFDGGDLPRNCKLIDLS